MATFPILSSGAVAQYPLQLNLSPTTQVIRFLDGSDQRCIVRARPLRTWIIKLSLLNDSEVAQLETFFSLQEGSFGLFEFPDPFSGEVVSNCRFGNSQLVSTCLAAGQGTTTITVVESYV